MVEWRQKVYRFAEKGEKSSGTRTGPEYLWTKWGGGRARNYYSRGLKRFPTDAGTLFDDPSFSVSQISDFVERAMQI